MPTEVPIMQFPYPRGKNSHSPAPFSHRPRSVFPTNLFSRRKLKTYAIFFLVLFLTYFAITHLFGSRGGVSIPHGTPKAVVVTVIDEDGYSAEYIENIKQNRIEYAKRHGYAVFLPKVGDYDLNGSPPTWAAVPATRHAITVYNHTTYFFNLAQNSLIMNPSLTIEKHVMDAARMESLMLKDKPIVPPDSVIKTYSHLKGSEVDFVITQGSTGLVPGSFIIRRGEWAKFFLDTWFDPLYRSYNFQKADTHALEHIVQWHPTILSKLAIIPQRIINAYLRSDDSTNGESAYQDGDFIIRFPDCDAQDKKNCEALAKPFSQEWQTIFRSTARP